MTQPQSTQKKGFFSDNSRVKRFADISRGVFFLVAALSLIFAMLVWQPIWVKGFKDFHTISAAIDNLNKTAQPASTSVPLMLEQMVDMNESMLDMKLIMQDMHVSMVNLEEVTPNIKNMTISVDQMNTSVNQMNASVESINMNMTTQLVRMSYLIDQMESKFSPFGMMPFNW